MDIYSCEAISTIWHTLCKAISNTNLNFRHTKIGVAECIYLHQKKQHPFKAFLIALFHARAGVYLSQNQHQ